MTPHRAARYCAALDVTLRIPDDLAARLGAAGDLSRRALEGLAIEEYRAAD